VDNPITHEIHKSYFRRASGFESHVDAANIPPVMNLGVASPYPWEALEQVDRAGARRGARARHVIQRFLDLSRITVALAGLVGSEAEIILRRITVHEPRRRPAADFGFELGATGVVCCLSLEPPFVSEVLSRVLRRPIALGANGELSHGLGGAMSAILLETARRSGATGILQLVEGDAARGLARHLFIEATLLIAGKAHQVTAALALPELGEHGEPAELARLGDIEIPVPIVAALGLMDRADFGDLVPGNAWFPGPGWWLAPNGAGRIALAAATGEHGVSAEITDAGEIVLRGELVSLSPDQEAMPNSEKRAPAELSEAVLDSPVVVRVEIGSVSLTAREWAELGPGDVIETGRRIAEPVVLRISGREVARGELVNVEGEIGVRIRELVGA
jgi:flagellar motor switch/type III secretory pathway protein FliN